MSCVAHTLAVNRGLLVAEDVDLIQEAVRMLPKRRVRVVELGVGSGTSALAVLSQRQEDIEMWSVDHDPVALTSAQAAITGSGFVGLWQAVLAESSEAAAGFVGREVDLLLVDAGHLEAEVRADLEAWLPLVRRGAPVWCHDYRGGFGQPEGQAEWPEVKPVVDAFVADGRLRRVKLAGWGWLGVKL